MTGELDDHLVADVMFASDRTCCLCYVKGKQLQVHHIDENSSNHDPLNLAVVCKDCHGDVHHRPGFARKFSPELVTKYRDHWHGLIASRREAALTSFDNDDRFKFIQEAMTQLSDCSLEAVAIHREKERLSRMMTGRMGIDVAHSLSLLIECRQRNSDDQGTPLPKLRSLCESSLQLAVAYGVDEAQEIRLKQIADRLRRLFPGEDVLTDANLTCRSCGKGIDAHR